MQGKLRQEELEYWLRRAHIAGFTSTGQRVDEAAGLLAERVAEKLAKKWMAAHGN